MKRIQAKYADKRACPHCGSPVERLGYDWHSDKDGEWYFEPQGVIVKDLPEGVIPQHNAHRWEAHEWTTLKTYDTAAGTRTKPEQHTQYEYVVEFCCFAGHDWHGCGAMQERDTVPYTGETYDWMLSEDEPHRPPREPSPRRTNTMTKVGEVLPF